MKNISHYIAITISVILFIIPFSWLKPGFVDLGGDAGRLFFIDPFATFQYMIQQQNVAGVSLHSIIPYELFLYLLQKIIVSPTYMIGMEQGLKLSLGFFSIYLIVFELLVLSEKAKDAMARWVGIISGIVYVGFITKTGWPVSLVTHAQIFLNPLIFYLLLRFLLTNKLRFAFSILVLTLLYSCSFGYSAAPQLFSFYPLAVIFLLLIIRFILKKPVSLRNLILLLGVYLLLHAFHFVPLIASILDKNVSMNSYIFSATSRLNAGVHYFDANRQDLGKLSWELFQPATWRGQTIFILLVPFLTMWGFLLKPSRLLSITGSFFALTYFLVTANITIVGIKIYRALFNIPGFMMFRSFDEKWYYVFAFFYTVLFAVSFYLLLQKKKKIVIWAVSSVVIIGILFRILPFLKADFYKTPLYQSKNVSGIFDLDPDLLDALAFTKKLPHDGSVLTVPLTLPYFQIIHGEHQGAYVGISMVQSIAGRKDYPGFLTFGAHSKSIVDVLKSNDTSQLLQLLSILNIRYIFRNTDSRIMDLFPKYPYYRYDMTIDIPSINSQSSYDQLLQSLPASTLYKKGFFEVLQFDDSVVRPQVYIPDSIFSSESGLLKSSSFRSAYVNETECAELSIKDIHCDSGETISIPSLTYARLTPAAYNISFIADSETKPFIIALAENFHPSWTLELSGLSRPLPIEHIFINGFGNAWIVDPQELGVTGVVHGTLRLGFQKYFVWGWIISGVTAVVILGIVLYRVLRRKK